MQTHFARIYSGELDGIRARCVEVEVDVHVGLHSFSIVGLADKALTEAKERVGAALMNSGMKPPSRENRKIVVNLAPADMRKAGSQYDVAIAVGYLLSTEQMAKFDGQRKMFVGELALDGSLRPVQGVLNIACMALARGMEELYVPAANGPEAAIVSGMRAIPVHSLSELVAHLEGRVPIAPAEHVEAFVPEASHASDIADVRGQEHAKRALVVAAAGGHHLLMVGSPGSGKTMLAQAFAGIIPQMTYEEMMDVTQVHSAAGCLGGAPCVAARPFRAPHHTASSPSVVGGGSYPRPGEISLAHRGVLFLDEFPEFRRDVIESLREPLEAGKIAIARAKGSVSLPARFMLVAAMNPCPCGYAGDAKRECSCGAHEIARYGKKISGPVMDRIDIQVAVPRVELAELTAASGRGMDSASAREIVGKARAVQYARSGRLNGELTSKQCEAVIGLDAPGERFLERAWRGALLSARGYYRVLKVARTIADIEGVTGVSERHLAEAFGYRLRNA